MRSKIMSLFAICLLTVISAVACSAEAKSNGQTETETEKMKTEKRKLVVFFSHTGENYNVGYIEKGNTHIIADMIADAVGADRFEIVPEKEYPKDSYDECIEVAKREKQSNARPAIKGDVNVEGYDIIFLGYPNWWGEAPMCVYTFIEKHDWNGKTVIPFITHEGSGMGGTDRKISAACKDGDVAVGKGLAVQGKVAQENQAIAKKNVERWLEGLGIKK